MTSRGRLTLNVLLSFTLFERVTKHDRVLTLLSRRRGHDTRDDGSNGLAAAQRAVLHGGHREEEARRLHDHNRRVQPARRFKRRFALPRLKAIFCASMRIEACSSMSLNFEAAGLGA